MKMPGPHRLMGPRAFGGMHLAPKLVLNDKAVCVVPRAGSQSMRQTLLKAGAKLKEEYDGKSILWIREPFDRLATTFMIFGGSEGDYERVSEQIINGEFNFHWWPQTKLHEDATVIYPFEELHATWEIEFPDTPLLWINKSGERAGRPRVSWADIELELSKKTVMALRKYYQEDIKAHESSITR